MHIKDMEKNLRPFLGFLRIFSGKNRGTNHQTLAQRILVSC